MYTSKQVHFANIMRDSKTNTLRIFMLTCSELD